MRRQRRSSRAALAQHGVARQVAVGVVDLLEVVEVAEHHGQRMVVAARPLQLLGQAVVDGAVVELAGEAVERRQLVQPLRQAGVVEHQREMAGEGVDQRCRSRSANCWGSRGWRASTPRPPRTGRASQTVRSRSTAAAARLAGRRRVATGAVDPVTWRSTRRPARSPGSRPPAGQHVEVLRRRASWSRIVDHGGLRLADAHRQEAARPPPGPGSRARPRAGLVEVGGGHAALEQGVDQRRLEQAGVELAGDARQHVERPDLRGPPAATGAASPARGAASALDGRHQVAAAGSPW